MNKDSVIKTIKNIEQLLNNLKIQMGLEKTNETFVASNESKKINKSKKRAGSTKPTTELIAKGFFNTAKTSIDVSREFKKQAQNYSPNVIRMSLMRLVRKGLLEREGEGTSKNPWKYKKIS